MDAKQCFQVPGVSRSINNVEGLSVFRVKTATTYFAVFYKEKTTSYTSLHCNFIGLQKLVDSLVFLNLSISTKVELNSCTSCSCIFFLLNFLMLFGTCFLPNEARMKPYNLVELCPADVQYCILFMVICYVDDEFAEWDNIGLPPNNMKIIIR